MNIPINIDAFNRLTESQKQNLINYETAGNYIPNTRAMIIYSNEGYIINYDRNGKGKLLNIYAETIYQAKQKAIMQVLVNQAMAAQN